MKHFAKYESPIGTLLLESDDEFITKIELVDDKNLSQDIEDESSNFVFCKVQLWLDTYFKNKQVLAYPKIKFIGTNFQKLVWKSLQELATFGQTISYKDLANSIIITTKQAKMSCQAIGNAVAKNPLLIIVPCHRVVGSNKTLTGFSCGIDAKIYLLEHENKTLNKSNTNKLKWKVN